MELKFEEWCEKLLALQKQFNETKHDDPVKKFAILVAVQRHFAENAEWIEEDVKRLQRFATDKLLGKRR